MATPLGTLDRTPPPFFRQGPSALTKLSFCSALAIFLMVADTRLKITQPLRTVVATVLNPFERSLRMPVDGLNGASDYLMGLQRALSSETAARSQLARQAERASGVAGVYPPGLAVAKVTAVDRKVDTGFARIALAPVASADGVRHVLLLDPIGLQMPPKPEAAPTAPERKPAAPKKPPPRKNGGPA